MISKAELYVDLKLMKGVKEDNYEELIKHINDNHYVDLILAISHKDDYDALDIKILGAFIYIAQALYNNSGFEPTISDSNYDLIYAIYKMHTNADIIGAPVTSGTVLSHNYPKLRGTLDKIHFIYSSEKKGDVRPSLQDWINQVQNKLGRQLTDEEARVEMFCKWDGCSVIFELSPSLKLINALSRGYTKDNTAQDLTKVFKDVKFDYLSQSPLQSGVGLKTEVVMDQESFIKALKIYPFKNKRNAVAGILNSKNPNPELLKCLKVIPLQMEYMTKVIIPEIVYTDYPHRTANLHNLDDVIDKIEYLEEHASKHGVDIDGIVFRIIDRDIQATLGRADSINKYEVAYKIPPEESKSIIRDIEFQIGTLGNISAVAKIEPIRMKGNTIKSITLGSIERAKSLELGRGDEVKIKYDVIPYLYTDDTCKVVSKSIIPMPTHCHMCNKPLGYSPLLSCVNTKCPARQIGRVVNYLNKLNIKNVSEGIVTTLYNRGFVKEITDLYKLDKVKTLLTELPGFGPSSVQIILDAMDGAREMYDWQLFGALGCTGVSRKIFKKIFDVYDMENVIKISKNSMTGLLTSIDGIGATTATSIMEFIVDSEPLICSLLEFITIKRDTTEYTKVACFSKVRDHDFAEYLKSKQVKVIDSVNKTVNVLIVKDTNESSAKIDKARKNGTEVVSLTEAYEMFGYTKK